MDMALLDPCDEHRDEGSMPHAQRTHAPFLWTFLALSFSKSNGLHETPSPFIPAISTMPTISPFRHGYTGRRAGETGSALVVKGRREPSPSGSVENGLPPATRGKRQGFRTGLPLLMPERRVGRACAAHMVASRMVSPGVQVRS